MKVLAWVVALAFVLWTVMFSPLTAPHVPFWWMMTGSAITLSLLATFLSPGWWRGMRWNFGQLALGVVIAVGLWCVFFVGDKVAAWLFDFARSQVAAIYMMRQGWSPWLPSALMLVLIGPAEEIFWRGYVQRTLAARWGAERGFPFGHAALCLGSRWVMQFHVGNGRVGGRLRVGRDISFLSEMLSGHCGVSCLVGCRGLHLVSHLTRCFPFQSLLSTYCVWDKDMCAPHKVFSCGGASFILRFT